MGEIILNKQANITSGYNNREDKQRQKRDMNGSIGKPPPPKLKKL